MSVQAMSWAMSQKIVTDAPSRHVLLCLANYAGADGRGAFPAAETLAKDTGLSERTVRHRLAFLEEAGVIRRGNQAIAAAYIGRADRRPVVYDLALDRGATAAPRPERGAADDVNGVQLTTERGAGAAPDPSINHQQDPNNPPTPHPQAEDSFDAAWRAYPKRAGGNSRQDARRAWDARLKQGHDPGAMLEGVERYAAYIRATGREGTEYVKQAATFFGPGLHFAEPWDTPRPPGGSMHGRIDTGRRTTAEIEDEAEQMGFRTMGAP